MREKIFRVLVGITRGLRVGGWCWVVTLVGQDLRRWQRVYPELESAPQQCAFAGSMLFDLLVIYVVARAVDRVLALSAEGMTARPPTPA